MLRYSLMCEEVLFHTLYILLDERRTSWRISCLLRKHLRRPWPGKLRIFKDIHSISFECPTVIVWDRQQSYNVKHSRKGSGWGKNTSITALLITVSSNHFCWLHAVASNGTMQTHTSTYYSNPRAQTDWHSARYHPQKSLYRQDWHLSGGSTVILFTTQTHTDSHTHTV